MSNLTESQLECHPSNSDTLSNCLEIINSASANTKKNTHRPSSHGQARQKREAIQDRLNIKALETQTESDYFYSLIEDSF